LDGVNINSDQPVAANARQTPQEAQGASWTAEVALGTSEASAALHGLLRASGGRSRQALPPLRIAALQGAPRHL